MPAFQEHQLECRLFIGNAVRQTVVECRRADMQEHFSPIRRLGMNGPIERMRLEETMSPYYTRHLFYKALLLAVLLGIALSGCTPRVPRLRIINEGPTTIKNLVVLFPQDKIAFGDVPAGTATAYKDVPNGVYQYSAYRFDRDGRPVFQPVIDWMGEVPMSGNSFSYTVDFVPSADNSRFTVELMKVERDDCMLQHRCLVPLSTARKRENLETCHLFQSSD